MAMLFVTHNIALAGEVADRIAVLQGGAIVEEGSVRERAGRAVARLHAGAAGRDPAPVNGL